MGSSVGVVAVLVRERLRPKADSREERAVRGILSVLKGSAGVVAEWALGWLWWLNWL